MIRMQWPLRPEFAEIMRQKLETLSILCGIDADLSAIDGNVTIKISVDPDKMQLVVDAMAEAAGEQVSRNVKAEQERLKGLTTDKDDPRLIEGKKENGQNDVYLVMSEEERAKGFVRPVRHNYVHKKCGAETSMGTSIAETYAADPGFYGSTYCVRCKTHFLVSEFVWAGTDQEVGS